MQVLRYGTTHGHPDCPSVGSGDAAADVVTPTAGVTSRAIARGSATSQSAQFGRLFPGQALELVGSVPSWDEVRLTPRRRTRAARIP
jgi:hypothetical protein